MTPCPRCQRPLTAGLPRCVYCGAEAPAGVVADAPEPPPPPAEIGPPRVLVVLRLEGAEASNLARALSLAPAEAAHRARRGGWHLHRIADGAAGEGEAARLAAAGLRAVLVPEAEARLATTPLVALGGGSAGTALDLRTTEGDVRVDPAELLLVVQGPIAREYQTSQEVRRTRTATLEAGYRFHLHRRVAPRPIELDPGAFDFGLHAAGASSLLQLSSWVRGLAAGVDVDEGFRRLPPEMGVAEAAAGGPLAAADALAARPGGRGDSPMVLDNLRQFRFYSGWRAAVERRFPPTAGGG